MKKTIILLLPLLLFGCRKSETTPPAADTLFTEMPADYTGIDFVNQLEYDADFNIYTYRNFFNGGGVAIGDINNDSLPDIYFTGNMTKNRLYLNRGNFKFEDITETAGVGGTHGWSTGVSMVDLNADGFIDIYIANSGNVKGDDKENELFINNGDGTFTERAAEYGLADQGYSTHAAFFDYDKDGDLDVYLLNNSYQAIGSFNLRKNMRPIRDAEGGDKLLRNDDGKFVDVSEAAGIYGSVIGFGLGVTVGDIDRDGWQDLYICNDFFERDYIYMNNRDGTFREELTEQMRSISGASMGADMADLTGDGYPEIFVTEMLPGKEDRFKTTMTFENWDKYQYNLENDYYHQFTRNMLHRNNADGTFSEVGRLAGTEATDWSWSALITDFDNDGLRDIYVSNGIHRDILDKDYLNFISADEVKRSVITKEGVDFKKLIDVIPTTRIENYAFRGTGDLRFENKATEWGLATPSHSNGAAYGDLDNDGDLDLVVNNINMPGFVYRNNAANNWLKIELVGKDKNVDAFGAKISVTAGDQTLYTEQMPMRGFESSMDFRPNFGLGKNTQADEVRVEWLDGSVSTMRDVAANQTLTFDQNDATQKNKTTQPTAAAPLLTDRTAALNIDYKHEENRFVDFDRDRLLFHMLSTEGPKITVADVNGDGLEDFYVGGARDQAGQLFLQKRDGKFAVKNSSAFEEHRASEDLDCLFFDADGDGDQDLLVASGSNEFAREASAIRDRLYFNDGRGNFTDASQNLLGGRYFPTSCFATADIDNDGDLDIFSGERLVPKLYGVPANGHLWLNDGTGKFTDKTNSLAPELRGIGMLTDAVFADIDGDKDADLILTGEWMPLTVFTNENGKFEKNTQAAGFADTQGWWNCVKAADLDNDGDLDLIAGNHGQNSRFRASAEKPVTLHVNDFDQNGTAEQILTAYQQDAEAYPMILRHELVMQIPKLKKKYLKYENFKFQKTEDIFTPEEMENSVVLQAVDFSTSVCLNNGDGTFVVRPLPTEAQLSPTYGILIRDFNDDGNPDILTGGNLHAAKPEVGRYDASYGLLLTGDGKGNFTPLSAAQSGVRIDGEVRDFATVKSGDEERILVVRNNAGMVVLE